MKKKTFPCFDYVAHSAEYLHYEFPQLVVESIQTLEVLRPFSKMSSTNVGVR